MAIALVQQTVGNGGSVSFPGATTPGNFLLCVLTHEDGALSTGPTSSHGTWQLAVSSSHAGGVFVELWYLRNLTGVTTVVNMPGVPDRRAYIAEYSGVMKGTTALDKIASANGTSTTLVSGTTATTVKANELWVAGFALADGGVTLGTPTNGFAIVNSGASGGGSGAVVSAWSHLIAGVTGAANTGLTASGSDEWVGAIATFIGAETENIAATIPSTATLTASMLDLKRLTGQFLANSTMTAAVKLLRDFVSTIPAVTDLVGLLSRLRGLTTTIQTFADMGGSLDVMSAELVIVGSVEGESEGQGGEPYTLLGTFPVGKPVRVSVGPTGTLLDELCYSGVPGQGNVYFPRRSDQLRIYLPRLDPGTYRIHAESNNGSYTLINGVVVRPRQFRSSVFGLRKVFPPRWGVGPRKIEEES